MNINQVLLGATVLAVGNTLADYFANSSLSALGYGVMACTGSLAGQLFNFLIGFGANTLKINLNKVTTANPDASKLQSAGLHSRQAIEDIHSDDNQHPHVVPPLHAGLFLPQRVLFAE
jgi:Ca2+/Na+ antiporter